MRHCVRGRQWHRGAGLAAALLLWALWLSLVYWGYMLPGVRALRETLPVWAKGAIYIAAVASSAHVVAQEGLTGPLRRAQVISYLIAALSVAVFFACFRRQDVLTVIALLVPWMGLLSLVRIRRARMRH